MKYVDNNTFIKLVWNALKQKHAMECFAKMESFTKMFIEVNLPKFQFIFMKSFSIEVIPAYIEISDVHINGEKEIKLQGITLDDK